MINHPETIANEATDAFNALIYESERFRDWNSTEVQALVIEVEKLRRVDARKAFGLLGSLAAICGRVFEVSEYYGKALRLPDELETKHEFWKSLANIGLYHKAQEFGTWLLDPKRGFFPSVWPLALSMGQLSETWSRLSDAKRTYPDLSQIDFSKLESAVALMDVNGLRDEDIISVLDLMGEIQREHRIMFSGPLASVLRVMRPPNDAPYLYFTMLLDASVSEIHTMNRELAKLIVERLPEGAFPQGMTASFAKADPLALSAAA